MTPYETYLISRSYKNKQENEIKELAWAVANIINYTGRLKKVITPARLLGIDEKVRVKKSNIDNKKEFEEIKRLVGGE